MTLQEANIVPTVAISISESPDMGVFGLGEKHLLDAMTTIALRLLSSGKSLAYGGDLRPLGFTDLLFELLKRYQGHPRHNGTITITDYLAWPVHIQMQAEVLATFTAEHEELAQLVFLDRTGARMKREKRLQLSPHEPDENEWVEGLTKMRRLMREETRARIVLGGRVEDYKGCMPGIAEETLLSLQARQPVFLLGGFGGCTRDIAETVGLVEPWAGSRPDWKGRPCFKGYSSSDLHNGLSDEDNAILARTPHIHRAAALVSRGLRRVFSEPSRIGPQRYSNA